MTKDTGKLPISIEAVFGGEKEDWPLDEEKANEIVLNAHPDLKAALEKKALPQEIPGPNGKPINPRLHLTMHILVERQLAADRPKGISELGIKLEEKGIGRHEIRHLLGEVFANQLLSAIQNNRPIHAESYLNDLRDAVEAV